MISEHENTLTRVCQVCQSKFTRDSAQPCDHICFSCEITLLTCPICLMEQNGSGDQIYLDETVTNILESQSKTTIGTDQVSEGINNSQSSANPSIQTQIIKHCFLGAWDLIINGIVAISGIKPSKNNKIAQHVHTVMKRIGRQTGRSLLPKIFPNVKRHTTLTTVKVVGGLAAVLICIQICSHRLSK